MRRFYYLLLAVTLFALPTRAIAAEGSNSEMPPSGDEASASGSGASAGSSGAYQDFPSSATPSIKYRSSELPKSAVNQIPAALAAGQAGVRDTTLIRLMKKKSSFQTYVETATGRELEVFGRNLFREVPTTFAPLDAVQVNPDYVVGPGDELQIKGWGMVNIEVEATVSRSGDIYIPKVGTIRVAGVKYRDLQGYLKTAIGRIFRNFELSVSIAQTRSVHIYVVGNALRPGAYTLSSMSTILNALFASGGPSTTGSLRNIKLKRSGEPVVSFDLYDMLLFGDKSSDLTLKDGDVVYIPAIGPQVALLGDVKTSAIYEMKQKTSVADLVGWAGGFESAADLKNVIVDKNIEGRYQTLAELQADWTSIDAQLSKLPVAPTDIIRVVAPGSYPLEVKVKRAFVRVDGEVNQSGVYELQKGETLKSLLSRIGGVSDKGYLYGTRLNRESVRREQQRKLEESIDRYEKDIETSSKQRIAADPAQAAAVASEVETQRRLVQKLRAVKAEGRIVFSLKSSSVKLADMPDFLLKDGDRLYIPETPTTVDVIGAVYSQSTFIYEPHRSVNGYLVMAGGVTPTGQKSELYRICADGSVKSNQGGSVNPGDAIVVPERLEPKFNIMKSLTEIATVLYQFGIGAAALKTLRN